MSRAPGPDREPLNPDRWGLRPLALDDVDAVHEIFSDARTWAHLPGGVFISREQSVAVVQQAVDGWRDVGLGPWAVLVKDLPVGIGGVKPREGWWELGFRLSPQVWGHGLATWVASVAVSAAHRTREGWPVVARSLSTNPASDRVSELAGLEHRHEAERPDGLQRVVRTDRPVPPELLQDVLALDRPGAGA